MKNDNKTEYYMETDDTLDIGKKPLPVTDADEKIWDSIKEEFNIKS